MRIVTQVEKCLHKVTLVGGGGILAWGMRGGVR